MNFMSDALVSGRRYRVLRVVDDYTREAVAITGVGVFETLREVAKLVLAELRKG